MSLVHHPAPSFAPPCAPPPPAPASIPDAGPGWAALLEGMPLPEMAYHLELAQRRAGAATPAGLHERILLLRGLLSPAGRDVLLQLCQAGPPAQAWRTSAWLARLQAAWFAQQPTLAVAVVQRAMAASTAATPAADLLVFHVFAALALSCDDGPAAPAALRRHADAVRMLAARYGAGHGALPVFADALAARRDGAALAALRGFEDSAAAAGAQDLHWLAALACEQAAGLARDNGLAAACRHYRALALQHYRRWGALGHAGALQEAWCEAADMTPAGAGGSFGLCAPKALALSIAHEINQPLAAVTLHAVAARKWLQRAEPDIDRALDSLALIGAAGRQAGDIVRGMQRMATGQAAEMAGVAVDRAVADALRLLRRPLRRHRIALEQAPGLDGVVIAANGIQLQQVVTNLVVNAIEAHAGSGAAGARRIRVSTRRHGDGEIEIAVSDNGPGIAPAQRRHVFTSPFSTKPRRPCHAQGMGLSISLAIVRAHGGHIWFEPAAEQGGSQGACFRLRLPAVPAPDESA